MLGFLLRFLALYLLLMIPWPGVESTYRSIFIRTGSFLYSNLGEYYDVTPAPATQEGKGPDVLIVVPRRDMNQLVELGISSREVGYLSTAVAISLILATPLAWLRRLRVLVLGVGLTLLFVAVRPLPLVLYTSTADPQILRGTVDPTTFQETLGAIVKFFGFGQPLSYIVPIIIWILVAVRPDVLVRLMPELGRTFARSDSER